MFQYGHDTLTLNIALEIAEGKLTGTLTLDVQSKINNCRNIVFLRILQDYVISFVSILLMNVFINIFP